MNGIDVFSLGKPFLGAAVILTFSMGGAYAAKLSNNDSGPQTIVVTEGASSVR